MLVLPRPPAEDFATETRVAAVSVWAGVYGRLAAAPDQDQISGDLEALEHEVEAELEPFFEVAVAAHIHGHAAGRLGHRPKAAG